MKLVLILKKMGPIPQNFFEKKKIKIINENENENLFNYCSNFKITKKFMLFAFITIPCSKIL